MWNVALTDADAAALAAGLSPLLVRPDALLVYAPLVRGHQDRAGGVSLSETASAPTVADHPPGLIYPSGLWTPPVAAVAAPAGTILPHMMQMAS